MACDGKLVKLAAEGDTEAFNRLVEGTFRLVYSVAYARLLDVGAAEDLVQETYLRAFLHLKELRVDTNFTAWIVRIARNLATNWLRDGMRRSRLLQEVSMETTHEDLPDAHKPSPRDQAASNEEQIVVREAIERLPADAREIILLHYGEGVAKADIAGLLGVDPATVGRRLKNSEELLRKMLLPITLGAPDAPWRASPRTAAQTLGVAAAVLALPHGAKAALIAGTGDTALLGTASAVPAVAGAGVAGGVVAKILAATAGIVVVAGGLHWNAVHRTSAQNSHPIAVRTNGAALSDRAGTASASRYRSATGRAGMDSSTTAGVSSARRRVQFAGYADPGTLESRILTGTVRNMAGQPIANTLVTVEVQSDRDTLTSSMTTGKSGRFVFSDLPEGGGLITADSAGYAPITPEQYTFRIPRPSSAEMDLTMEPPVEMRGRVVNEANEPVVGTTVTVFREWYPDGKDVIQGNSWRNLFVTETDAQGSFVFSRLKRGYVGLVAEHPSYATWMIYKLVSDSTTATIVVNHGGTIRGCVADAGTSVPGVELEIDADSEARRELSHAKAVTDAAGHFEAGNLLYTFDTTTGNQLVDGWRYTIKVKAPGREFPMYRIRLTRGQPTREILLQPSDLVRATKEGDRRIVDLGPKDASVVDKKPDAPHGTASISGQLRALSSVAFEKLTVSASADQQHIRREVKPTEDGRFRLEGLPSGDYSVRCSADQDPDQSALFVPVKTSLADGDNKVIDLIQQAGGLEGHAQTHGMRGTVEVLALEPESGWFSKSGCGVSSAKVRADGSYCVNHLAAGKYMAVLGLWGDEVTTTIPTKRPVRKGAVPMRKEFVSDGKTTAVLNFDTALYEIRGTLVDAGTSRPIAGAKLTAPVEYNWFRGSHIEEPQDQTGSDGRFRLPPVPDGHYRVRVEQSREYPSRVVECSVSGSDIDLGKVPLSASKGGLLLRLKLSGNVKVDHGTACRFWRSSQDPRLVGSNDGWVWDAGGLPSGMFKVAPLEPGEYNLVLTPAYGSQRGFGEVVVPNISVYQDTITQMDVQLEPGTHVKLMCEPGSSMSRIGDGFIWLSDASGQTWPAGVSNHIDHDTWLAPGAYVFGVRLSDGAEYSVPFRVDPPQSPDQEAQNVILALP